MDNLDDISANAMIGRHIGVYRLEEEIGRGGMGAVYRAERIDGEFDQTVAVKLIKRGMDTDMILKRFRRERQILAALNHPNIAYFLGGGSTEDGLPYFVMEFIAGRPLYKYCDATRLDVRQRLAIFRQICWAVAAAHDIQVIHRDLKPSNIMVKDDGKPKLLDFGIAKVLDPDLMLTDIDPTATSVRAMTPEYASPEQISGEPVDTASDIYSLGVILYELLTGHRPYRLHRQVPDDVARVIREEEPTNPSGSLTRDEHLLPANGSPVTTESVLQSRNASLEALRRDLSGDLDRIILKTLRKKTSERYRTATDLADDITNYLDGRPVNAEFFVSMTNLPRPRKQSKLSLAILPFRVIGATQGDTGEEFVGIGLADALISRLSSVQRLIVRPTSSVLPFGETVPLIAAQQLGVDFVLDGSVRIIGGRIRVSVQLYSAAEDSTRWARAFDEATGDVLELEDSLAAQVVGSLLSELTAEERRRLERRGTMKPDAYEAYIRGRYFWSRFTDDGLLKAVAEFNKAIAIDPDYALPYIGLSDYYIWSAIFGEIPSNEGFPKAQEAARRALEIDDTLGEAYAVLAFSVFLHDWNWSDAEYLTKRALELSPNYAFAHECYSNFLVSQGRFEEGIAEIRRAEELDPVSPRAILMTAWSLYQTRDFTESVSKARKAVEMQDKFPQGMLHLGNALAAAGNVDEAVEVLRKSAETWGKSGLPRYMLAHARAAQGNQEAVRSIIDKLLQTAGEGYMQPYFIAVSYVAAGDNDKAFEWFEKAFQQRSEWLIWIGTEPKLDSIRSDPRYLDLLRRTNNPIAEKQKTSRHESPITGDRERSIAVLPFRLITAQNTGSTEDEYLSLGLADAVTMRLSNVRRFLVRPTSSVLPYASQNTDPYNAGRELGVEFVLDGIIRHVGSKIRITAQLLDVGENATRWSMSFAEEMTDVLELEDLIAEQVSKSLIPQLSGDEKRQISKRGTNNPEAHDAYLQGRYFWNQFTPDSFPKSIAAFKRAVELDPNYALAWVGIGDYYTWAAIYGLMSPDESHPQVLAAAQKALALDDTLAEAHAAIGLYHSNLQEFAEAEKCYRRALQLNPNYPLAHEWLSSELVGTGRFEEGVKHLLLGESLDPMSLRPKVLSAWTLYQTRDYPAALSKARELQALNPDFMQTYLQLANVLLETGQIEEALGYARQAVQIEPNSPLPVYVLCFVLVAAGLREEALETIAKWEAIAADLYIPPYFLAMSNLAVDNIEIAFDYLEKARLEKSAWTIWFGTEPKLDKLRDDPRYSALLHETSELLAAKFAR